MCSVQRLPYWTRSCCQYAIAWFLIVLDESNLFQRWVAQKCVNKFPSTFWQWYLLGHRPRSNIRYRQNIWFYLIFHILLCFVKCLPKYMNQVKYWYYKKYWFTRWCIKSAQETMLQKIEQRRQIKAQQRRGSDLHLFGSFQQVSNLVSHSSLPTFWRHTKDQQDDT